MGQQFSGSSRIYRYPILSDFYGSFWEDVSAAPCFISETFSNSGIFQMEHDEQQWFFCIKKMHKWRGKLMIRTGFHPPITGIFVVGIDGQPHQGWFSCPGNLCWGTYEVQHTFPLYMEKSWCEALMEELVKPYFLELNDFLLSEREKVCPELEDIYAWTKACPIDKVKVVILGQDPYPSSSVAHGLAFSMKPGKKPSKSLQRIYKELKLEGLLPPDIKLNHGYLWSWAEQGVLLLNTCLTVKEYGSPGSHMGKGWETFTDAVIKHLNKTKDYLVFILWGDPAKDKASLINERSVTNLYGHLVLPGTHPAARSNADVDFLSYDKLPSGELVRNKAHQYFKECNDFLKSFDKPEINWASILEKVI